MSVIIVVYFRNRWHMTCVLINYLKTNVVYFTHTRIKSI